jgi:hypothetical protein
MVDLMVDERNETNDDKRHQTKGKVKERGSWGRKGKGEEGNGAFQGLQGKKIRDNNKKGERRVGTGQVKNKRLAGPLGEKPLHI